MTMDLTEKSWRTAAIEGVRVERKEWGFGLFCCTHANNLNLIQAEDHRLN